MVGKLEARETVQRNLRIEAITGHEMVNEIAIAYEIHPSQVATWKTVAH